MAGPWDRRQALACDRVHRRALPGTCGSPAAAPVLPRGRDLGAGPGGRLDADSPVPAVLGARRDPGPHGRGVLPVRIVARHRCAHGAVPFVLGRSTARRGHLPEEIPVARSTDRRDRRRHRPIDPPAGHQGAHQQHHRRGDGRRRRRFVRASARGAGDPGRRGHSQLHRRAGGLRAIDGRALAVPIPR